MSAFNSSFSLRPLMGQLTIGLAGFAIAWFIQDWRSNEAECDALLKNYSNRAVICTEALAHLRIGDMNGAIDYLDDHAIKALHGVPNWQSFEAVPEAGQYALSQAKTYRSLFPTNDTAINWYLRDAPFLTANQMTMTMKYLGILHDSDN